VCRACRSARVQKKSSSSVSSSSSKKDKSLAGAPRAQFLKYFFNGCLHFFDDFFSFAFFSLPQEHDYNDKELAASAKAGVIEIAVALFDFDARSDAELSFKKDDYIEILKKTETVGWWKGRLRGTANTGLFPR